MSRSLSMTVSNPQNAIKATELRSYSNYVKRTDQRKRTVIRKQVTTLLLQNDFETLDVESNFTAHKLPNRREDLSISNPSNNANNSLNNNFSNKLNSTRWQLQVVICQNLKNDNDYQKSTFAPGYKLYSEPGKHHFSTSNNSNIVVFGDSIPNFSRICKYNFNGSIISGRVRFKQHQRISYVMSMWRCKTLRTIPLSSTWQLMIF